jgi:flagellar basal body P-ring formation protein FlgA
MTIRSLLLGTTVLACLCGTALADGLRLRAEAIVEGDTVQLGHLIEGMTTGAETPVFRAPAPGTRGSIRADRVLAAARDMKVEGIDRIDLAGLTAVRILRPGRTVTRGDMEAALIRAFSQRGAKGEIEIILDDHLKPRLYDIARTDELRIKSLVSNSSTGRFEARISLSGEASGDSWIATGTAVETREIAVPSVDINRGDAVEAKDLTLIKRRVNMVPGDVITTLDDLVGMVPRRPLRAGEPIRQADLAKPIIIEKNQIVTVIYATSGITLSMRARAQNNASKGDNVRVQNLTSKRYIEGIATGQAQVSILSAPPVQPKLAAANSPSRF